MTARRAATLALLLCTSLAAIALTGCSAGSGPKMGAVDGAASAPMASTAAQSAGMPGKAMTAADMPCGQCRNKGHIPTVVGTVSTDGGVQVAKVGIVNDIYTPNNFTAKAGAPIKVVFTGKADKCLAVPSFSALKKKVDIKATGSGTIDLGTLAPGRYEFTCGMGSYGGTIVVE